MLGVRCLTEKINKNIIDKILSPKQQADILTIIAQFCPIEGIKFDHYVIDWEFD